MSSPTAVLAYSAATTAPRALVLRSCRPHVLDAALESLRRQAPTAQITALSHAGHRDSLLAQGIQDVIEIPGNRFGLRSLPLKTLAAIRAERFDVVLLPLMTTPIVFHLNLITLALAIGAPRITFYSPDLGLQQLTRWQTMVATLREWRTLLLHRLDVPLALALMAIAVVAPRRQALANRKKRVLHVITSWGVGGAQRQLAEFIQHCPTNRTDIDLLVLSAADGDFSTKHLRGHDVRIRYSTAWPRLAPTILEIASLCRSERYDVVHTWLFLANALGVAAARLAGTPRVISSVRNLSLWKRTWANQRWFRLADILNSRAADVVTVNGSALVIDHAEWAQMPASRIAIVPNGLSTEGLDIDRAEARKSLSKRLGLAEHVRIVGTVGRLAPEKDHGVLLDAWQAVNGRAHLVIVGDGPLKASLEARTAGNESISFLGESDHARELMAGFDLFVLPSRIEGFPNVLLEAAMLGVPILATRVGAARDIVIDHQDLVPVGDTAELSARLVSHLAKPLGPRRRAADRRKFVRRTFTINKMVERWLTLYDRS